MQITPGFPKNLWCPKRFCVLFSLSKRKDIAETKFHIQMSFRYHLCARKFKKTCSYIQITVNHN